MEWLERMNRAMGYIEEHLDTEEDMEQIARQACCSSFNFQRMFSFMADVSLTEYIRRRRLSRAALELQTTNARVLDVALRYGYSSPVSFARAFCAVHGVNPGDVRKPGVNIKNYPRLTFELTVKGVNAMEVRMESFGELRLLGCKEHQTNKDGENFRRIPQFWNEMNENGTIEKIMQCNDDKNLCLLGVCANGTADGFDYYIATGSSGAAPAGMEELILPPATYAIFTCRGPMPDSMQSVWKRIFTEWLPASGCELADGPQIEWYSDDAMDDPNCRNEVWIPVVKKA